MLNPKVLRLEMSTPSSCRWTKTKSGGQVVAVREVGCWVGSDDNGCLDLQFFGFDNMLTFWLGESLFQSRGRNSFRRPFSNVFTRTETFFSQSLPFCSACADKPQNSAQMTPSLQDCLFL